MIGTIMLANRFGIERGYATEDLRLLEVLANNASVALQYDRLEQAVIKLRALQEQLHHQAYHDPLTGLPNRLAVHGARRETSSPERGDARRCCSSTWTTSRSSTTRSGTPSATRCSSPSPAGCATPCGRRTSSPASAATSSRSCCRTSRIPTAELRGVATRMLRAFDAPVNAGDELVSVHLSVGIADSRRTRDPDELIREADLAMYQAKTSGKGRFAFFDPPMAAAMLRRHDLKEELAKAIERERDRRRVPADRRARHRAQSAPPRRSCAGSTPCAAGSSPVGVHPAGRGDRPDPGRSAAASSTRPAGRRAAGAPAPPATRRCRCTSTSPRPSCAIPS